VCHRNKTYCVRPGAADRPTSYAIGASHAQRSSWRTARRAWRAKRVLLRRGHIRTYIHIYMCVCVCVQVPRYSYGSRPAPSAVIRRYYYYYADVPRHGAASAQTTASECRRLRYTCAVATDLDYAAARRRRPGRYICTNIPIYISV